MSAETFPILRILGIDPGLRSTGFGIVEKSGQQLSYIGSGCINTESHQELPTRIKTLFDGINKVISSYLPGQAVLEKVFVNINPQSTLLLGQARGAALTALVAADLPVAEYTALQIKQAVVGQGKANKKQVQEMVRRLLKLPGYPSPDAADALACAICHAHAGQVIGGLSNGYYRMKKGRLV